MLYINGNTIRMTRGDTAYLTVPITINDNEDYTMGPEDTLTISLKKTIASTKYSLQKTAIGSNVLHIAPEDTSELAFGKYVYDIQLNMANGDVYTLIDVDEFEIMAEVTCE